MNDLKIARYVLLSVATAVALSPLSVGAQSTSAEVPGNEVARVSLPDSPGAVRENSPMMFMYTGGQSATSGNSSVASPYARVIKPFQTAPRQTAGDKVLMSLRDVASWQNVGSSVISAGWSHAWDSRPHYGTDSSGFAERFGASMLKGSTQTISRDAIYANIFHEDTRYYIKGRGNSITSRAVYAATRVLITRKDSGGNTINFANIAGLATANGLTNLYYPTRDQGFGQTAQAFGMGFVTNALTNELKEFIRDAVGMVFHKKQ